MIEGWPPYLLGKLGNLGMTQTSLSFKAPRVAVCKLMDQDGKTLFRFSQDGVSAYAYELEIAGAQVPAAMVAKVLSEQGIALVTSSARHEVVSEIERCGPASEDVKVARSPGWLALNTFVFHDGTAYTDGKEDPSVIVLFKGSPKWVQAGSHQAWLAGIAALGRGQTLLQTFMCFGLVPLVLKFLGCLANVSGNIGLQVTGPSSCGKTTLLCSVSSLWGGRMGDPSGFLETWNVTINGVETLMGRHESALLCLDEATLAGADPKARANLQKAATFMLDSGRAKSRHGSDLEAAGARLVTMSSSNSPLSLGRHGEDLTDEALSVRMSVIDLGDREYGILDHPGDTTAEANIRELRTLTQTNFGHGARLFAQKMTGVNHAVMSAKMRVWINRFRTAAGYDQLRPVMQRICDNYALAFATGMAAGVFGVLPREWNTLGGSILRTFNTLRSQMQAQSASPLTALETHLDALGEALVWFPNGQRQGDLNSDSSGAVVRSSPIRVELQLRPEAFDVARRTIPGIVHVLMAEQLIIRDGARLTTKRAPAIGVKPERFVVLRLHPTSRPGAIRLLPKDRGDAE